MGYKVIVTNTQSNETEVFEGYATEIEAQLFLYKIGKIFDLFHGNPYSIEVIPDEQSKEFYARHRTTAILR